MIGGARRKGIHLDRKILKEIVDTNEKKRFSLDVDGSRIRANQGHSIAVDVELEKKEPPTFLYHGTATRFYESIQKEGLKKMNRQHVHLSADQTTAVKVGTRHGKPIVLIVRAGDMYESGYRFFLSENGVWLTEEVPARYIGLSEP
ncbi:RNA 2'-phosphotransferase [Puniceicoccaceae bacterium K14]|nr:RNA 2'-phosphotransferase [Puniceicoccaceae bacterium K14]